jgi:hypothetical protein
MSDGIKLVSLRTKQFGDILGVYESEDDENIILSHPIAVVEYDFRFIVRSVVPWCDIDTLKIHKSSIILMSSAIKDWMTKAYIEFFIPTGETYH